MFKFFNKKEVKEAEKPLYRTISEQRRDREEQVYNEMSINLKKF